MIGAVIWIAAGIAIILYNNFGGSDTKWVVVGTKNLDFGYVAIAVGVVLLIVRGIRSRGRAAHTQAAEPEAGAGKESDEGGDEAPLDESPGGDNEIT